MAFLLPYPWSNDRHEFVEVHCYEWTRAIILDDRDRVCHVSLIFFSLLECGADIGQLAMFAFNPKPRHSGDVRHFGASGLPAPLRIEVSEVLAEETSDFAFPSLPLVSAMCAPHEG